MDKESRAASFNLSLTKTAFLIAGLVHVTGLFKYNGARIYQPHTPIQTYEKERMLPSFQSKWSQEIVSLSEAQSSRGTDRGCCI